MANALSELMADASEIYVMGHSYADMDAVGAAAGICCAARKRGKLAQIVIDQERNAAAAVLTKLRGLPEYENVFVSGNDAFLKMRPGALLVVVDTNRPDLVESQQLLESCNRVAVIDHHRRAASYIENAALTFYEPYASSVCELVVELLQELVEQSDILRYEAEAMMAGIVTDTKNFTMRTGERTFDAAAFLRRAGADPSVVKRLLQNDYDSTVTRYAILERAQMYRDNICLAAMEREVNRVVAAQAADELLNISGVEASVVLYPNAAGEVILSARSIGSLNVQVLLEKLGGGGNKSAAGAQMKNTTIDQAMSQLKAAIDEYLS
jgi:c-di-AMP phosphodiesterase-like protein